MVTAQSETTDVRPTIYFEKSYFRTIPGIVKCLQLLFNLIGFICIQASGLAAHLSQGVWFTTVSMIGFWITGILLMCYLFRIVEKFDKVPWLTIELIFCAIMVIFYLIAASLAVSLSVIEAYTAAGVFGYFAMVVYGYDVYLKYLAIKSGRLVNSIQTVNT